MTDGRYQAIRLGPDLRPANGTVLAEGPTKADVAHLWEPGRVVIAWSYDAPPPRRLSEASLGSVRRKRLRRRLAKKAPLFADQLFQDELTARPDYYAGKRQTAPDAEPSA